MAALSASALMLLAVGSAPCRAAQGASISAAFRPERLGKPTTVALGFQLAAASGSVPSPLTGLEFRFPANLGIATSGLGVASCALQALEDWGPAGCPSNSIMGTGSALARFQVGPTLFSERAALGVVAGPSQNGYVRLLISATGTTPVAARIVMPTLLLPGHLQITVPLVPSLPEGPPVAVVSAHVSLGGNLTYEERVHGRLVHYRPAGIGLPRRCPKGGFRFSAKFSFLDGTSATAGRAVPCPRR